MHSSVKKKIKIFEAKFSGCFWNFIARTWSFVDFYERTSWKSKRIISCSKCIKTAPKASYFAKPFAVHCKKFSASMHQLEINENHPENRNAYDLIAWRLFYEKIFSKYLFIKQKNVWDWNWKYLLNTFYKFFRALKNSSAPWTKVTFLRFSKMAMKYLPRIIFDVKFIICLRILFVLSQNALALFSDTSAQIKNSEWKQVWLC